MPPVRPKNQPRQRPQAEPKPPTEDEIEGTTELAEEQASGQEQDQIGQEGQPEEQQESEVDRLKRELEEERRERQKSDALRADAERRAAEQSTRGDSAEEIAVRNQETAIINAVNAAQRDVDAAESALVAAHRAFAQNPDDEVAAINLGKAQRALTEAAEEFKWQGRNKKGFDEWKTQRAEQVKNQPIARAKTGTPADVFDLETVRRNTPRSAEWIDRHPEFMADWDFYHDARAASLKAESHGHKLDTDPYFEFVENDLRARGYSLGDESTPARGNGSRRPPQTPTRQSTAAPPSRSENTGHIPATGGDFRLMSPTQKEFAELTRPDLPKEKAWQEWWNNANESERKTRNLQ